MTRPLADLHRHLDGSLRRSTVEELASRAGLTVPEALAFSPGMGLSAALSRFAAEHGVTLAIVGETRRSRWYRLRNGSIVDRLLARGPGLDVLVISAVDRPDQRRATPESDNDIGGLA